VAQFSFSDRLPAPKSRKIFSPVFGPTAKEDLTQMTEARMQENSESKPGSFCWVELGTSITKPRKIFTRNSSVGKLRSPDGPDSVYTMLKLDGKDVGGLYKLMPDMVAREFHHTG
jgi:hypothetical protein